MQAKNSQVLCSLTVNPEYIEFAIPELKALLNKIPVPLTKLLQYQLSQIKPFPQPYQINHQSFKYFPFVVLNVPNFEEHRHLFENLCTNAVMVQKAIHLISMGKNYQELIANRDQEILKQFCRNAEDAVLCDFESKSRMTTRQGQVQRIHQVLGELDVRGHVNFKAPKIRYQLYQQHVWYQGHHKLDHSETLKQVYFGIELSTNRIGTAKFNLKYQLSNRIYLGPTSADNDLAFLMCNQALVQQGSLVIDPFVGTAGLLIPAATKKALTFGSDLDIRVLNGYSVGRINKKSSFYDEKKKFQLFTPKIMLNFQQYNISPPNIIRIDSTQLTLRGQQFFDAIITDPPYGIRAMSRSTGNKNQEQTKKQVVKHQPIEEVQEEQTPSLDLKNAKQEGYICPQKEELSAEERLWRQQKRRKVRQNKKKRKEDLPEQQKQFKASLLKKLNQERVDNWQKFDRTKIQTTQREKIFESLLNFALKHLRKGGRLIFLYPVYQEEEYLGAKSLPQHQGFRLIDLSRNMMASGNSRILVTLQKQ